MSDHAFPTPAPVGQIIKPPRKTSRLGKPASDPNVGSAPVDIGSGIPQNFSSRLPGQPYEVEPS